jgi:hypothetical protein
LQQPPPGVAQPERFLWPERIAYSQHGHCQSVPRITQSGIPEPGADFTYSFAFRQPLRAAGQPDCESRSEPDYGSRPDGDRERPGPDCMSSRQRQHHV